MQCNDENMPYFTTIFVILFQTYFFKLFSVKTPRSQCLPSLSKKVTRLSIFFLKLAIWQIFGSIQPNFLRKFWLFYVKTNDLQPVSCFVPVLAFVCLDFFEYKYSAAESRWVCRRAKLSFQLSPLAHFHKYLKTRQSATFQNQLFGWVEWISSQNQTESSNFVSNHWYVSFAITVNGNN